MRVDFPEPDTPVTQVSRPSGNSNLTFWRLLPRAPSIRICPLVVTGCRDVGTAIERSPDRYAPVSESG